MKKIILSLAIVGVVGAVAIGGTIAYFSDTETSTGNTFTAGTLVFNINTPNTEGHQIFNVSNMKPGDVEIKYVVVTNDGTIDQKWKAWVTETGTGETDILDNVLKLKWTIHPTDYAGYDALTGAGYTIAGPVDSVVMPYTAISSFYRADNGHMLWASPGAVAFEPGWAAVYKVEAQMDSSADNTYQGTSFVGNIDFLATQYENTGW